ncbi:heat shock protein 81-2 [Striga asiatica]|uniref:Heat shock protein 81-2 n=1 Tax=Striga asiatica TaxID=4170 RepID=A0A5A7PA08_STRAF|nr:heat shock protein 81-2 [Striga asiatica]
MNSKLGFHSVLSDTSLRVQLLRYELSELAGEELFLLRTFGLVGLDGGVQTFFLHGENQTPTYFLKKSSICVDETPHRRSTAHQICGSSNGGKSKTFTYNVKGGQRILTFVLVKGVTDRELDLEAEDRRLDTSIIGEGDVGRADCPGSNAANGCIIGELGASINFQYLK